VGQYFDSALRFTQGLAQYLRHYWAEAKDGERTK